MPKNHLSYCISIFKTGSKTEVNNYRLISILSNFSKIFEKLVVARPTNFLKKQNFARKSIRFSSKIIYHACNA